VLAQTSAVRGGQGRSFEHLGEKSDTPSSRFRAAESGSEGAPGGRARGDRAGRPEQHQDEPRTAGVAHDRPRSGARRRHSGCVAVLRESCEGCPRARRGAATAAEFSRARRRGSRRGCGPGRGRCVDATPAGSRGRFESSTDSGCSATTRAEARSGRGRPQRARFAAARSAEARHHHLASPKGRMDSITFACGRWP
jgi:hypothetical protein